jgi:hypothetical protein
VHADNNFERSNNPASFHRQVTCSASVGSCALGLMCVLHATQQTNVALTWTAVTNAVDYSVKLYQQTSPPVAGDTVRIINPVLASAVMLQLHSLDCHAESDA